MRGIIKRLPYKIKLPLLYTASLIPQNLRQGKEYKEYANFLADSDSWDSKKIVEFQNLQLRLLIKHAYENVPFYTDVFNNYGIKTEDIKDIRDLEKLPLIDKEIVKLNRDKFIAKNFDINELNVTHTGGTTSSPMHFFNTNTTNNRELAFFNRIWKKYGYTNQTCLVLRGDAGKDGELYKYNPYQKKISINTRNLNDKKMDSILKVIEKFNPQYLQAYPSLVYLLAKHINERGMSGAVGKFNAVFCSSEKMYDFQREEIKKAFVTEVIDYYGHNERLTLMEYCPKCNLYHVIPEYGVTEFLTQDGNKAYQEGQIAQIVGTGFNNYAFPLIRYKTSDMVTTSGVISQSNCGKPYLSVKEIDGRSGDFLITRDGKHYSPTMLEFAIRYIENFKDLQLIQNTYDQLDVLIVPNQFYKKEEGNRFIIELQKRIDTDIHINIKMVEHISRPFNQKHRFIISNIK
ncbi:phenylacetate--CoA ligase family protein [Bacillus thuringiensis]|uniref:Phenylacetate--CoA ligase family protein n=1 Tax=Bacillus thuringiensis subsp. higo TaxID=132266 RepID=A0A9X6LYY8_BACUH|nr:phenylacetate--CoA ligase family protein [Bacillus thuringiensis]MED2807231.1 phenylacetate--CoA ligase family protein [Bacillus thuringiensis]MED2825594.1 phenylacetate--CoA ligase family protein [Bacillus thuringiensis]MED2847670.1 phenylacetate--CoA ligase family protein [Bacillus thuringiensis]MED2859233.1 phenylacetate--CoA ligase family protein [Bacillus thuringiensis]OUB57274.1 hypothetical protein BK716_06580 [Bacillus thuringiensis serovar higo]